MSFATLAATLLLYVVAPKGFLPLQDTASITAVTEAGPDVSFAEMQSRQTQAANAIKSDPDVTGVVSVIGAGSVNPTTNVGRLVMTLKPRGERRADGAHRVVAQRDAEHVLVLHRIESEFRLHHGTQRLQRRAQRPVQGQRARSRAHAAALLKRHQERVPEQTPKTGKLRRKRGLADVQPGCRLRHIAFRQQDIERYQQIQIDAAQVHYLSMQVIARIITNDFMD